jgi:hypothetical protein
MTPIPEAVKQIVANPAVVIAIDTCSLLDLFRQEKFDRPKVPADEIRAVAEFLSVFPTVPNTAHLVVPELVPREFADHAGRIEKEYQKWLNLHDENQLWLAESANWLGFLAPAPSNVSPLGISSLCRRLADQLLTQAVVLARDQSCLERAVARLIDKTPPSQNNEMKDSMNLEQILELSRQLQRHGFVPARVFVSSNTKDFADPNSPKLHPALQQDFAAAGLEYFTCFRTALGQLRFRGQLP